MDYRAKVISFEHGYHKYTTVKEKNRKENQTSLFGNPHTKAGN